MGNRFIRNDVLRILVTGATGFIGRRLVQMLRHSGHQVLGLASADGDIADTATFAKFRQMPLDYVFHLAGRTFVPDAWREPVEFHRVNMLGTLNVLELCRSKGVPLTFISSYLYGVPDSLPMPETHRIDPNNPYALSKLMAESASDFYAHYYDVPVTVIRPFNIYGIGQKAHFLIPEIIAQVKAGEPIHVKDLKPRRDYLYLDDLVDGLLRTLQNATGYRVYNFGFGSSLSVRQIIDAIQTVAGTSLDVVDDGQPRRNEIPDVYADISKARRELAWSPKYSFEDGIREILGPVEQGNPAAARLPL